MDKQKYQIQEPSTFVVNEPKVEYITKSKSDFAKENVYTHDEIWTEIEKKLNDHYHTNYKFK